MSDFLSNSFDLASRVSSTAYTDYSTSRREEKTSSNELTFTDMLQLMVTQFQNQTIDNQADTSDMMNQLVQMSVVQAMTAMTEQVEQLSTLTTMSYSASLVGKEVTVGVYNDKGELEELTGTVTASGTYDGEPVIFLGSESYLLSSVMAVGRLPATKEDVGKDDSATDNEQNSNNTDTSIPKDSIEETE